jgi:hypothetical protein
MLLLGEDDDVLGERAGSGTAEVSSRRNFLR